MPMMQHNTRLANPLDTEAKKHKEVSGKRKKTDEDHEWLAWHEWIMSLYLDEDQKVILPARVIQATIENGAKDFRKGIQFKSSFNVVDDAKLINPDNGRQYTLKEIEDKEKFIDCRIVVVKGNRIMRTRPIFNRWTVEFDAEFLPETISIGEVKNAIENAGKYKGFGDYRPRYGKFQIVEFKEIK
jgi:hypothetical protein